MPRFVRAGLTEEQEKAKKIVSAKILGVQERAEGGVHFVYVIEVTNAVGDKCTVFRRYRRFDALLQRLSDKATDDQQEDLPALPTKKFLGRSHTRKIAEERVPGITLFLEKLMRSPFMTDKGVVDFFTPEYGDGEEFTAPVPARTTPPPPPSDEPRISGPVRPSLPLPSGAVSPPSNPKSKSSGGLLAEIEQRQAEGTKTSTRKPPPPARVGPSLTPPKVPPAPTSAVLPPPKKASATAAVVPPKKPGPPRPPTGDSVSTLAPKGRSESAVPVNELAGLLKAKKQAALKPTKSASSVSSPGPAAVTANDLSTARLRSTFSSNRGKDTETSAPPSSNPYAGVVLSPPGRSQSMSDAEASAAPKAKRPSLAAKPALSAKPSVLTKPSSLTKSTATPKPALGKPGSGSSQDFASEIERLKSLRKTAMEKDDDDEVTRLTAAIKSAKAKAEAEEAARIEAEAKAKREAEAKAKREAEAKAKRAAEAKAQSDAAAKAKAEAAAKAEQEASAKAAEAEAKRKAEAKKRADEEAKARAQAEANLKRCIVARAKAEAELERLKTLRKTAIANDDDDEVTRLTMEIKKAKMTAETASKTEAEAKSEMEDTEALPPLPDTHGTLVCDYNGVKKEIPMPATSSGDLTYDLLVMTVRHAFVKFSIILNYKDSVGDIVAIRDQEDLDIFLTETTDHETLEFVITNDGDFAAYKNLITAC
eukprot:m.6667 g.6667  ORF g.6667 m.6667 type:complete len:706 (-) comp3872_c0_seq1:87-2204(-)